MPAVNLSSHAFRWRECFHPAVCLFGVQQRNRRPILVAGLPIRKYLTQMKRPHLKYANAPCQARRKRGRGKGGVDDDTCTRVARNCTFARPPPPPPPMREGTRGRASAVSGEVSPATSTNLDLDLSPAGKSGQRKEGSETDDCRTVAHAYSIPCTGREPIRRS